jgi:hypothetical protein
MPGPEPNKIFVKAARRVMKFVQNPDRIQQPYPGKTG